MKRFIEPTYTTKKILFRDAESETDTSYIDDNVGNVYPLIRVNNRSFGGIDIVSFSLNIGGDLLPTLYVTINDSQYNIRDNDFGEGLQLLTLFVGNNKNTTNEPIKLDFIIDNIFSEAGGENVSYSCTYYNANIYKNGTTSQSLLGTSFEFLKQLAQENGLGFVSNVDNSNDTQVWIRQRNMNMLEFIQSNIDNFYISDNDLIHIFVDQYQNLNYISLVGSLSSIPTDTINVDPFTNENLDSERTLLLTNKRYGNIEDDIANDVKIAYYTPISDYGSTTKNMANDLTIVNRLDSNNIEVINVVDNKVQVVDNHVEYVITDLDNTHQKYNTNEIVSKFNASLLQSDMLVVEIPYYVPQLYMFECVPVEIYNSRKLETIDDQSDESISLDKLQDNSNDYKKSFVGSLNDKLSSNYIIREMVIKYSGDAFSKKGNVDNTTNEYTQVNMKLKLLNTK